MTEIMPEADVVDLGEPSPEINALLQRGVVAYRSDRSEADRLFRDALERAPQALSTYFCLYKIHTYMGGLDYAAEIAAEGVREAARQAGWASDPRQWPACAKANDGPARFALFTLKALSFIELKRGRRDVALAHLETLARVDPAGSVGWKVIGDLAQGLA